VWENECCTAIVTQRNAEINGSQKTQICSLNYLLKTTNMKIKFINVFLFLSCIMSVASSSVLQECTATTFRLADLIQVDVELTGGKNMCPLHKAV